VSRALIAALLLCGGCTELDILEVGAPWNLPRADDGERWARPPYQARSVTENGRWEIRTDLPRQRNGCVGGEGRGELCEDRDHDGLLDTWEEMVLDRVRPIVRIGGDEDLLFDPGAMVGSVGRVAMVDDDTVLVIIVLAYSRDYGRCSFTEHAGDTERVALRLRPLDGGSVEIVETYTAAHEYTTVGSSARHVVDELTFADDPRNGQPRWRVFSAEGKHATYVTPAACDAHAAAMCLAEGCPGDRWAPELELLIPVVNAGEEDAEMSVLEDAWTWPFIGSYPWDGREFCGDRESSGVTCSPSLRSKLRADPFE
jgi:hypothetical protein